MKIKVTEYGSIQLEEVYNPVLLKTKYGEELAICMRDSGFEFNYNGKSYSAKNSIIESLEENKALKKKVKELEADIDLFGGLNTQTK